MTNVSKIQLPDGTLLDLASGGGVDWIGTKYQYAKDLNSGVIQKGWVCILTDECSNGELLTNIPHVLFEPKHSEYKLYNESWLISEEQWNSGNMYTMCMEALIVEQGGDSVGSLVLLPSGSSYIKRGLPVKLHTEVYTDYDFVINTVNNTFRLPKRTKLEDNSSYYLYFYVGETVSHANLLDASRIQELLTRVLAINYDAEIQRLKDEIAVQLRQSKTVGVPIFTLDNNLIQGEEIWLDGATVSRSLYSELFAVYGETYGKGDGSTTFQLPNFKNRTIWGSFDTFGYISAGIPNIVGSIGTRAQASECSGAFSSYTVGSWGRVKWEDGKRWNYDFNANSGATVKGIYGNSDTVQPPAIKIRVKTRYK